MKLYSNEMIDLYLNKKKKGLKTSFCILPIVVIIFIIFMIIVKLKTKALFIILGTIDLSIFAVIFIYNLLENIIKSNDLVRHIGSMLKGEETKYEGSIKSISNIITLKRNIHIVEVEINGNNSNIKVYFNIDLFEMNFDVDDHIIVQSVNNFITEYEVIKNE